MNGLGLFKNMMFALALVGFSAPQAEAIEIVGGANPAAHMNDDMITQVRAGGRGGVRHHGGGNRGGMHHGGGHRGGMHRPPGGMHRPPGGVHRPPGGRAPARQSPRRRQRQSQRQSQCEPKRQPKRQCQSSGLSRRRGLGRPSGLVPLAGRRRDRGRCGDWLRLGGERGGLGRRARPLRASAGTIPTRAATRASGTSARNECKKGPVSARA